MNNYVKIDRKILEWEWYKNLNTCRLFFHILLKANWKEGKFEGKKIERGQFVSSISKLSEETGLTQREIRTAIGHLKSTGELTVKTYNKYSVFTVNNYCIYQTIDNQNDKQTAGNRHSNDNLTTTIEERKEEKEDNKKTLRKAEANALFEKLWDLYPEKKGKGKVSDAKKLKLLEIGFDEMARAIDRYKRYVDSIDYLHYQHGSTFFNSGYVDYLDANYVPGNAGRQQGKTNQFNQFPQNDYDFSELERELLSN